MVRRLTTAWLLANELLLSFVHRLALGLAALMITLGGCLSASPVPAASFADPEEGAPIVCEDLAGGFEAVVAAWYVTEEWRYVRSGDRVIDLRERDLATLTVTFSWDANPTSEILRVTLGHYEANVAWPDWFEGPSPMVIEMNDTTWNGHGRYYPDVRAPRDNGPSAIVQPHVTWTAHLCTKPAA